MSITEPKKDDAQSRHHLLEKQTARRPSQSPLYGTRHGWASFHVAPRFTITDLHQKHLQTLRPVIIRHGKACGWGKTWD